MNESLIEREDDEDEDEDDEDEKDKACVPWIPSSRKPHRDTGHRS